MLDLLSYFAGDDMWRAIKPSLRCSVKSQLNCQRLLRASRLINHMTASQIEADMVLAGHVHDYRRLTRSSGPNGRQTPYIVAGAGDTTISIRSRR
jgi:hypothetical protein